MALSAGCESTAQTPKPPGAFAKIPQDCFVRTSSQPANLIKEIGPACAKQYYEAPKLPAELANAGLNAGTAYNSSGDYALAKPILEAVSKEGRAAQPTRDDATYQLAITYYGQASALAPGLPDRSVLFESSIGALNAIIQGSTVPRGSPLYNSAVFQRASAYESRGATIIDHNYAIEGFAQIASLDDKAVDASLKAKARDHLITVATKAGSQEMAPDRNNAAAAQRAITLYEKALPFDRNNAELNMGLGEARLVIARSSTDADKAAWYNSALNAYTVAQAGGAPGASLGLARASRGLGQLSTAITYYMGAGDEAKPELAETQLEFARSLTDPAAKRTAYQAAEKTYAFLASQPTLSSDRKAAYLIKLAEVQGQQDGRVADVRRTLEEAIKVDGQSPGTNLQLAQNYYSQGLYSDAKTYFDKVVSLTGGNGEAPPPGPVKKMKADAYHHLSLIRARDAVSAAMLKDTVDLADKAVELAGRVSPYREQDCIARIKRGGKQVLTGDSICFSADDQSQGLLLRGMYNLKQAQLADAGAQSGYWNSAKFAFDQGLRQLPNPSDATRPTFSWPGAASPPPAVGDLLKFGKAVVDGCYGQPVQIDLAGPAFNAAKQFYVDYGVFSCR